MRAYDIIYKKREGGTLSRDEIKFLIDGYVRGEIPDYQMAAWAMTVFFQGMNAEEMAQLTMVMAESGDQVDLSCIPGFKIDKHSTGGVGDTTTLVLAPLVSAAGLPVAKMSGKGLGHTGGTIDKLESIPGFKTDISRKRFISNVNSAGISIVKQTGNLTPADKKLYSLRDVTASVESIPLIASSIMSKKFAGGANGIILDVKTGKGAFMKTVDESRQLAEAMVRIGKQVDRKVRAIITDMNQPLGLAVGNSLEVKEAIATLKGNGPEDLEKLCLNLGANMLLLAGKASDFEEAYNYLGNILASGKSLVQFKELIKLQGGKPEIIDNPDLLPGAKYQFDVPSKRSGYINQLDALAIGKTAMMIGAGRETKEDTIDYGVGVVLKKKYGYRVKKGETLARLYINDHFLKEVAVSSLQNAFKIKDDKPVAIPLIYDTIN